VEFKLSRRQEDYGPKTARQDVHYLDLHMPIVDESFQQRMKAETDVRP